MLGAQAFVAEDWVAFYKFSVDAGCTLAHDRVTGAVVNYCYSANEERLREEGLVSEVRHRFGEIEIRVLEYNDSGRDIKQIRNDVGEEEILNTCWMREFFKANEAPRDCNREFVFLVPAGEGRNRQFSLVACSEDQVPRALGYVRAELANMEPEAVEERLYGKTRPISLADVDSIRGDKTLRWILSEYGPPEHVWPRYPDGFSLIYPVVGISAFGVRVDFSKDRQLDDASLLCPMEP
jgi:hypothetical protein